MMSCDAMPHFSHHAIISHVAQLTGFVRHEWHEFIEQLVLALPAACRRLTIYNLSFVFLVIKSKLSFAHNVDTDTTEYGQLDDRTYTIGMYEDVQAWMMDPERCPTAWDKLAQIRKQNPQFKPGNHDPPPAPGGSSSSSQ